MALFEIWESLLDIFYPMDVRCFLCEQTRPDISVYGICKSCERRLPFIEGPSCLKCGKMILDEGGLCLSCQSENHVFLKGTSVFEFGDEVKTLIYRYKYRGEKYLSSAMIHWMTKRINLSPWQIDSIVPVPLHPKREKERGFNQAFVLAKGLSKNTKIPLIKGSLLRVVNTPQQAKLKGHERRRNLKGAFAIKESPVRSQVFKDKSILLVDDVYTTGTTLNECSRILLNGGAKRVYIITLATGSDF